ncbi:uncharacterized protein [Argopecten irradians]|uniref:uncharacterized protein n=1 Tax=Argopecten irradians TaxID=31199 RepID=UPI003712DD98
MKNIYMMESFSLTKILVLMVAFALALGNVSTETDTCVSLPTRGSSGNCPPLNENGTVIDFEPNCHNLCSTTADCRSFTLKMDYTICYIHQCPYFQPSKDLYLTYFRKVCSDGSCHMEIEAKGLDANCTSPPVVMEMPRDTCLQTCAESTGCEAVTLKTTNLCYLFNCTSSIQTDLTQLFYILECTETWMFTFSHRQLVSLTPDCYYDDLGLGTKGFCSDDVIDEVYQNSTLSGCQNICDSTLDCRGLTFNDDLRVCRLHNCSANYISVNGSSTSFHLKRCESSNQFETVGANTRATCAEWTTNNYFKVITDLDCQIACLRHSGCEGVTVRPSRKYTCLLQSCSESVYIDDPDISFYSKNQTGAGFTNHGTYRVGRCSVLPNISRSLDLITCADLCFNMTECQGFSFYPHRFSCKFHSCRSYKNLTNYVYFTFYWRVSDQIVNSLSNSSEPELPTESPLEEKEYFQKNVTCDFQPTTNLNAICTSTNNDSVLVSNETDCFHLCEMKDQCSGVTLRSAGITCYLQYCGESEYTTNVYLRFLSKQVTKNCSYKSKGPRTVMECGYISSTTYSFAQCQDTCTQHPDCSGFQYVNTTMTCRPSICPEYIYKESELVSTSFYTNTCEDVLYYKDHGPQSAGTCGIFKTMQVQTENECQLLCSNNSHCQGVTVNKPRYQCWRHSCQSGAPFVYIDGSSYLKVCNDNFDTSYTSRSTESTLDGISSTAEVTTQFVSNEETQSTFSRIISFETYFHISSDQISQTTPSHTGVITQQTASQVNLYGIIIQPTPSQALFYGSPTLTSGEVSQYNTLQFTLSQASSYGTLYETLHHTSSPDISYGNPIMMSSEGSQFDVTQLSAGQFATPSLDLTTIMSSMLSTERTDLSGFTPGSVSIDLSTVSLNEHHSTTTLGCCVDSSLYLSSSLHTSYSFIDETMVTSNVLPSATLSSYQSVTNYSLMVFLGDVCNCFCRLENKTIDTKIQELKSNTQVDKSKLSSSIRKLNSAEDRRESSIGIGTVGVALIVTVVIVIVLSDAVAIFCK